LHGVHFQSVSQEGVNIGISFRWERFTDKPFGGVMKTGESNLDATASFRLSVSNNSEITTSQPTLSNIKITSSGYDPISIMDNMVSILTYITSGGKSSFGFMTLLAALGSLPYNFSTFLSASTAITPPLRADLAKLFPFVSELKQLQSIHTDICLSRLAFDSQGIWFIIKYPDLRVNLIKELTHKYSIPDMKNGISPNNTSAFVESTPSKLIFQYGNIKNQEERTGQKNSKSEPLLQQTEYGNNESVKVSKSLYKAKL